MRWRGIDRMLFGRSGQAAIRFGRESFAAKAALIKQHYKPLIFNGYSVGAASAAKASRLKRIAARPVLRGPCLLRESAAQRRQRY
ncbi:hypothetical protein [Pseudomonas sp. StFLB209]|uniref:hypothetical protein n=1 Tax=Pseudomonas sp. StFLB209 TaxID=1028989 RepID=UPI0011849ADA|nr:hypothetical protein [Pseudomonas sp. StFLB209]